MVDHVWCFVACAASVSSSITRRTRSIAATAAIATATRINTTHRWRSSTRWRQSIAVETTTQFATDRFQMHKVAERPLATTTEFVLTTACFAKVRHRRQFGVDRRAIKPTIVELFDALFRILFAPKLDIHIADHVFANVVAHVHLFDLAIGIVQLDEDFFEELVKEPLLLHIFHTNLETSISLSKINYRIVIDVLE